MMKTDSSISKDHASGVRVRLRISKAACGHLMKCNRRPLSCTQPSKNSNLGALGCNLKSRRQPERLSVPVHLRNSNLISLGANRESLCSPTWLPSMASKGHRLQILARPNHRTTATTSLIIEIFVLKTLIVVMT